MKNYMEELYPFFNPSCDGGAQGVYLKELGSKEVQRGICLPNSFNSSCVIYYKSFLTRLLLGFSGPASQR